MLRKKWAERVVIVVAALASIATSPKRWYLEANLPPRVPDKPTVVTLEASAEPSFWIDDGHGGQLLQPTDRAPHGGGPATGSATWPGRGRYFVPAGARVQRVEIRGICSNKLCSGDCKVPDTAYIKVVSATAIEGWIAEARSTPVTTVLDAAAPTPRYRVTVEASRHPIAIEISGAPGYLVPSVQQSQAGSISTFDIDWPAGDARPPVTVTWTVRASIQGECAGAAGCAVPVGEAVRIVSVETRASRAP